MLELDRRSFVLVGVVAVACGGDSSADGEGGSTGNDPTQGDDDVVGDDDDDDDGSTSPSGSDDAATSSATQVDTTGGSSGAPECTADAECDDPNAPICIDGVCLRCDDEQAPEGQCADIDAMVALCGPDGACVQCTAEDTTACTGNTPVCDASTWSCIKCTEHEQCPDSACDIETGACFETDCVVEVDADGGGDYLDINTALEGETDEACVLRVHTPADESFYPEALQIDGRKIALFGVGVPDPQILDSDGALLASGGAVVYVSAISLTGGVSAEDATLYIEASDLRGIGDAPLHAASDLARIRLTNVWINNYMGGDPAVVVDAGELDGLYTTVVGGSAVGLSCDDAAIVSLRNSFVVNTFEGASVDCSPLDAEYSAFEEEIEGRGNTAVGEFSNTWVALRGGSILRLSANSPAALATTARWTTSDPAVDIDGDPRPDRDGTPDFAGADVYVAR